MTSPIMIAPNFGKSVKYQILTIKFPTNKVPGHYVEYRKNTTGPWISCRREINEVNGPCCTLC